MDKENHSHVTLAWQVTEQAKANIGHVAVHAGLSEILLRSQVGIDLTVLNSDFNQCSCMRQENPFASPQEIGHSPLNLVSQYLTEPLYDDRTKVTRSGPVFLVKKVLQRGWWIIEGRSNFK